MLIERPWGITAYGHATAQVDPDHAVLRLAINRIDIKPDKALQATSQAVSAMRQVLRRRDVPDTAEAKARLYAQAAGVGLGPVVHIEDLNPDQPAAAAYRGAAGAGGASTDFAPGQTTVSASVVLGFQITH